MRWLDGLVDGKGYMIWQPEGAVPIKAWTKGLPTDDKVDEQLAATASLPFIHRHIAVMPDVHWGLGATIGSVVPTAGAIVPAAVGVDIGCGMMAVRTTLTDENLTDLPKLRNSIERAVPVGRTDNGGPKDTGSWREDRDMPDWVVDLWHKELFAEHTCLEKDWPKLSMRRYPILHLGTLGTGNHFIEISLDKMNRVWVVLHSGSRGIGNKIGTHFISLAKEEMGKYFIDLPDKNLAYLPEKTDLFDGYWAGVQWAQRFAMFNREAMMRLVLEELAYHVRGEKNTSLIEDPNLNIRYSEYDPEAVAVVHCHHNYVAREHHFGKNVFVTRKGAVRARKGDMGIIPGSMGARSYIVRGLGNPASFHSCSHGAGRVMSRRAAFDKLTLEDHEKATAGVECRKDKGVLDESPAAYKDIDLVMEAQRDLVEPVHELRQIICVKG
jgi:tRNA-splicing ligase RtcB